MMNYYRFEFTSKEQDPLKTFEKELNSISLINGLTKEKIVYDWNCRFCSAILREYDDQLFLLRNELELRYYCLLQKDDDDDIIIFIIKQLFVNKNGKIGAIILKIVDENVAVSSFKEETIIDDIFAIPYKKSSSDLQALYDPSTFHNLGLVHFTGDDPDETRALIDTFDGNTLLWIDPVFRNSFNGNAQPYLYYTDNNNKQRLALHGQSYLGRSINRIMDVQDDINIQVMAINHLPFIAKSMQDSDRLMFGTNVIAIISSFIGNIIYKVNKESYDSGGKLKDNLDQLANNITGLILRTNGGQSFVVAKFNGFDWNKTNHEKELYGNYTVYYPATKMTKDVSLNLSLRGMELLQDDDLASVGLGNFIQSSILTTVYDVITNDLSTTVDKNGSQQVLAVIQFSRLRTKLEDKLNGPINETNIYNGTMKNLRNLLNKYSVLFGDNQYKQIIEELKATLNKVKSVSEIPPVSKPQPQPSPPKPQNPPKEPNNPPKKPQTDKDKTKLNEKANSLLKRIKSAQSGLKEAIRDNDSERIENLSNELNYLLKQWNMLSPDLIDFRDSEELKTPKERKAASLKAVSDVTYQKRRPYAKASVGLPTRIRFCLFKTGILVPYIEAVYDPLFGLAVYPTTIEYGLDFTPKGSKPFYESENASNIIKMNGSSKAVPMKGVIRIEYGANVSILKYDLMDSPKLEPNQKLQIQRDESQDETNCYLTQVLEVDGKKTRNRLKILWITMQIQLRVDPRTIDTFMLESFKLALTTQNELPIFNDEEPEQENNDGFD